MAAKRFRAERGLGCWRFWRRAHPALVLIWGPTLTKARAAAIARLCDEAYEAGRNDLRIEIAALMTKERA